MIDFRVTIFYTKLKFPKVGTLNIHYLNGLFIVKQFLCQLFIEVDEKNNVFNVYMSSTFHEKEMKKVLLCLILLP